MCLQFTFNLNITFMSFCFVLQSFFFAAHKTGPLRPRLGSDIQVPLQVCVPPVCAAFTQLFIVLYLKKKKKSSRQTTEHLYDRSCFWVDM